GEPVGPDNLAQHQCFNVLRTGTWTLLDGQQTATAQAGGRFSLNNIGMIRSLASLGMGIVLLPEEVVADELASGKLRQIMPQWHGTPLPVYAMTETRL